MGYRFKLDDPWDANLPFQELVQRVHKIQEFATDGGSTIPDNDIVYTMYTIVYNTGLFYDDCDKKYNKARSNKTWANFQARFQAAQRKYKRKQKVYTSLVGYHGVNNLWETEEDTHDALMNLATVVAANRGMMMTHRKIIADLAATIYDLAQKLHKVTKKINTLKSTRVPETPPDRPPKWVNGKHICDAGGYCSTHGYCVEINHNSVTCRSKNEGHRDDVTRADNKDGNH